MRVDVYNAHDVFVATIGGADLLAFTHSDENNGTDSVDISTTVPLFQGYRLVWRDWNGVAHEHVCQDPQGEHTEGATVYTDTALNSICETFGDYIEDKRPYGYTFAAALGVALAPTRWAVGTTDQTGTVDSGLTFYHTSVREAINAILECGGELETTITVGKGGVTARKCGIRAHRGESSTHKRFSYGKDMIGITRTEHYGAITACYGYGKGLETDAGGYGRKLTFGDINPTGEDFIEDSEALKKYGRPDGNGGLAHVFGEYENSECEQAMQLYTETQAYLNEHSEPGVTYEADVIDLVQFDRAWEGCGVGDEVQIVDTGYNPELRLTGRVSKLVIDYVNRTRTVTLGNVDESLSSIYARQQAELKGLSKRSANWDVAASTPGAYLQQIIDGLNEQFNATGMSYCYTSFETGTIWSSVPLDENGKPTKTGGTAIQICSKGFRIANGTKADGTYNWRTFGTGDGFTADHITAGTITGGSNYWNLDTGDLQFGQGSISSTNGKVAIDMDNGSLTAQSGTIAGFTIGEKAIYKGTDSITSTAAGAYVGTDGIATANGTETARLVDGQLAVYNGSTKVGTIDGSAQLLDKDTGNTVQGVQIIANDLLDLRADVISVMAGTSTSGESTKCASGELSYVTQITTEDQTATIDCLSGSVSGNTLTLSSGSASITVPVISNVTKGAMKFINGLIVAGSS